MKYAIIADIHANLVALTAVLADSEAQGCSRVLCLGDIVGYGVHPKECLDLVRKRAVPCVKGNFDDYVSSEPAQTGFTQVAAEQIKWTRAQLGESDREWLRGLPHVEIVDGFTLVHATLQEPHRWEYVFDKMAAACSFTHQTTAVCFFGHTHVPVAFVRDSAVRGGTYSKISVDSNKQYFVNVGSVGQPRDNNPKAAYVVYDPAERVIELRRLAF